MGIKKPRPDYDPDMPVRAVCPACSLTTGLLISDDCAVCEGDGHITLGRRALYYDQPDVVSRAISIVLESAAQHAIGSEHRARLQRRVVPETVARLVRMGLMEPPPVKE